MHALTEKQTAALASVAEKTAAMPILHFGNLRKLGYVEGDSEAGSAGRGYTFAKITPAGLARLKEV